jgi:hypothetical protein
VVRRHEIATAIVWNHPERHRFHSGYHQPLDADLRGVHVYRSAQVVLVPRAEAQGRGHTDNGKSKEGGPTQVILNAVADPLRLIQDAASRGPLGSLILLFSLRSRPLASLGAVITILALAFDPFIQQIVQYPSILSSDSGTAASVRRSLNFSINATSTDWLNAVSAGIWSGAEPFAQQPSCPSGNCTWMEYSSTGWCSKCEAAIYANITDCRFDAKIFDVKRLNTTESCSVDFGHGNKIQVLGSYTTTDVVESAQQWSLEYTQNRSTIIKDVVWPLELLNNNLSWPLSNETYAGVTNPVVALGYVHVQRCDEADLQKGLCITLA